MSISFEKSSLQNVKFKTSQFKRPNRWMYETIVYISFFVILTMLTITTHVFINILPTEHIFSC